MTKLREKRQSEEDLRHAAHAVTVYFALFPVKDGESGLPATNEVFEQDLAAGFGGAFIGENWCAADDKLWRGGDN